MSHEHQPISPITDWKGQHFVSVDQITDKKQIFDLFKRAEIMKQTVENKNIHETLRGMSVVILFYQPSTRTFSSFEAASRRMGAYTYAYNGMNEISSAVKGETLPDTIRSIYQTTAADVIILRHPDDSSSAIAAEASYVPIVNAGSGKSEHPTQALLDLYSLYQTQGHLEGLKVAMVGDLLYGRTIKSLAKLLALVDPNVELHFISPNEVKAPREFVAELSTRCAVSESTDLKKVLPKVDAVYMTRVQEEWFKKANKMDEYERIKNKYVLTRHMVNQMKPSATVMHPLPRNGEIMEEVDEDPRAYYFEQMRAGLYIRMALLDAILANR
jgi:aspartate carbamoyltransferase catalytic subunit